MAFTQAQLDALDTAIAQGARSVQYADRTTVFHTLDEMIALRNLMASEIAGAVVEGQMPRPRAWYVHSAKGF